MSVNKDLYERLGLQGSCSRYQEHRYGETKMGVVLDVM